MPIQWYLFKPILHNNVSVSPGVMTRANFLCTPFSTTSTSEMPTGFMISPEKVFRRIFVSRASLPAFLCKTFYFPCNYTLLLYQIRNSVHYHSRMVLRKSGPLSAPHIDRYCKSHPAAHPALAHYSYPRPISPLLLTPIPTA